MLDGSDRRPTVVLVDDSADVRRLVRRLLSASGFDVVGEGGDGDEAILLAHHHEPDLLLLDASMPRADGIDAIPAILTLSPETRVVMFTGFEEPGLGARLRELGAADFIEKSLPLEDLPPRLMRLLDGPEPGPGNHLRLVTPAVNLDINEQMLLTEHVAQFRELFDKAAIGMATLTSHGSIVRANRALAALMSCTPAELIGVDYGRLTNGRGEVLDRHLHDVIELGVDLATFEHQLPALPGREPSRLAEVTLTPIRDSEQRPLYVFAQVQDVTAQRAAEGDLRRSEENFRRLVTAVREYAIFMLDRDGTVISWNPGAQRIKQYPAHEIIGKHLRVFYPPEEQAARRPEHNLELALRDGSHSEEGWRLRRDGSRFWASVVITAVYDEAGEHVGFAKVTRDLTRQREHEQERRHFVDDRIRLLAVTAHELRNPTALIDASAVLLADEENQSDTERDELLGGIRTSVDRLRRLAADLGAAARIDSDVFPHRKSPVPLAQVIHRAATRAETTRPGLVIEVDVPDDDAVVAVDGDRLGQALDNLLENAAQHGRPPISLAATVTDAVRIRVADAGGGISPDLETNLFRQFATSGPASGTGLGLYLVREIARRHGGDVSYHPPSGSQPAAFELTLPLASGVPT